MAFSLSDVSALLFWHIFSSFSLKWCTSNNIFINVSVKSYISELLLVLVDILVSLLFIKSCSRLVMGIEIFSMRFSNNCKKVIKRVFIFLNLY